MSKFKHMLAALALSIPGLLTAVTADPRPRTLTNPDGSTVTVRVHGNEFFHFMTDVDCTRILQYDDRGFIVNAVRDGQTLDFTQDNVTMLADEVMQAYPSEALRTVPSMQRMGSLDNSGRTTYPTIGKGIRSLVVLVEFADVPFTVENPKEYYTRQLNEPGFSDYGAYGSAFDYYNDVSNGQYQPQFDVYGPVKLSHDAVYFQEKDSGLNPNMGLLIRESLNKLHDEGQIDLSDYDYDNDGIVDTVFFYYAGYGSADSDTETIWPHQYDYRAIVNWADGRYLKFDGKTVGPYACANELAGTNPVTLKEPWKDGSEPWVQGIGTFVHEYGHVLGLPDLYDVEYSGKAVTPGKLDVMDKGSYNFHSCRPPRFSAYEQWVCRWLEFTDAEDGTHYDLKALGKSDDPTAVRIRIPMSASGQTFTSEYFIIESRDNSSWDSIFPESGLMVWRINYDKKTWVSNMVNGKDGSNVEIIYANGPAKPIFSSGAIYQGAPVELIPSKDYTYWKSPIITSIAYDPDSFTGSFDYNKAVPSDICTVLHDAPVAAADGSRSFKLSWDPVEGVDCYRLTVRVKSSGRIIGDFDAKDMGKETHVWIEGLTAMQWKFEMEAFVTCVVNGLAASKTSNVVVFQPSSLQIDTAVDGVEADRVAISGGVGCVNAPDGALVYDMTGKLLQKEGLAPGVYIVVYGRQTEKVLVR